ncbi:hypothetical protein FHX74_003529 [Friedmanniella endophytica]|uniref:Catalytic LigB subunit of aromatic ring-opening dioxygenase n=1 Tax=Microlunatus kandeliicorticis TaxID=1759536 RepID=A0A7W3IV87_9ACTN|nr:hypothetical protein [Microlunatus kandeliicorticis]MBA8795888.1 hypothetical protein [Microlunatus kandeliicorticis]
MSARGAVLVPGAPVLLEGLGGRTDPGAAVRAVAVTRLTAALEAIRPDVVLVLAADPVVRDWTGTPFSVGRFLGTAQASDPHLPTALGVGQALLAAAGWTGEVRSVTTDGTGPDDAGLGAADLVVVVGDGSPLRRSGGPDRPDPRAPEVDDRVRAAVAAGDTAALRDLDPGLARELMITGAPAWRRLAAWVGDAAVRAELDYADDPFGVFMIIAGWRWTT